MVAHVVALAVLPRVGRVGEGGVEAEYAVEGAAVDDPVVDLLPRGLAMSFVDFAATYAFACLLGIASNAPGGIGAFEMTMLNSVPASSPESMIASLLMFRAIYYLIPFVLAMALLGAHEIMRRWASLRADMGKNDPDAA